MQRTTLEGISLSAMHAWCVPFFFFGEVFDNCSLDTTLSALPMQFITLLRDIQTTIQGNLFMVAVAFCSDSLKATDDNEVNDREEPHGEQFHSSF